MYEYKVILWRILIIYHIYLLSYSYFTLSIFALNGEGGEYKKGCWGLGVGVLLVPLILNIFFNQTFRKHDCRIKIIVSLITVVDA